MSWANVFQLLCYIMIQSTAQDLTGLGDLAKIFSMLSGQDSCELKCPNGQSPTVNPHHNPSSNGCGSMGMKFDVSDHPGFTECCNEHDKCYDTCNSKRESCDEEFKVCLNNSCEFELIHRKRSNEHKKSKECRQLIEVMHSGTVGLGCTAFKEAQRHACWCDGRTLSVQEMKRIDEQQEL